MKRAICTILLSTLCLPAVGQEVQAQDEAATQVDSASTGDEHRDAIGRDPTGPAPYFQLSRRAKEQGRLEEAIAWLEVLQQESSDAGAKARAGVELVMLRGALEDQRRSKPESEARTAARVALAKGVELARQAAEPAAIEAAFRRALELDAGFADPRYNLGLLAESTGDRAAAMGWYEQYVELAPTMPQALRAEARIQLLRPVVELEQAPGGADAVRYVEALTSASKALEAGNAEEAVPLLELALALAPEEDRADLEEALIAVRGEAFGPADHDRAALENASPAPSESAAPAPVPEPAPRQPEYVDEFVSCSSCYGAGTCTGCGGRKGSVSTCRQCQGSGRGLPAACGICKGDGRSQCQRCSGRGEVLDRCASCVGGKSECDLCHGRGKTGGDECYTCSGRGTTRCPCGGSGSIRGETCVVCGGAGQNDCTMCSGRGKSIEFNCFGCGGSGRDDCSRCQGEGQTEQNCPDCQGTRRSGSCHECSGQGRVPARCTACRDGETWHGCASCRESGRCTSCDGRGQRVERVLR